MRSMSSPPASRFVGLLARAAVCSAFTAGCGFDRGDRWEIVPSSAPVSVCQSGQLRCNGALETCADDGRGWRVERDCPSEGLICAAALTRCAQCNPGSRRCDGADVLVCASDGEKESKLTTCNGGPSVACRDGACRDLCDYAHQVKSNVGCEYWAADLDNAVVDPTHNAAAQQFAIVVSNPQPDLAAEVTIEQDDGAPGQPAALRTVAKATILPLNLETFRLGPREVDGSPDGQFNTGTGTALTRHAYRLTSQVPIVAYQFNPLENVNVFSNDATLLKPVEALTYQPGTLAPAYVVVGWPQTIASTDDPDTDFSPDNPVDLRAFLTIIGTRENTHVRVVPTTRVIPGGPVAETPPGKVIEQALAPFEVLNLETGGHNADFTSTTIDADQPIVVFSGSEASDAPHFDKLSLRYCCADHLEEQLDPVRAAGQRFVLAHAPSRTRALHAAGSPIGEVPEPEYFRVVAVSDAGAKISTSLPYPDDNFQLPRKGDFRELSIYVDATLTADAPVIVGDVTASQEAAGVPRGLPGGDPSLVILPPIEQYRPDYLFLTPDKYAFDFITVVAAPSSTVLLDGQNLDGTRCETRALGEDFLVYRCQLSFPVIDPARSGVDAVRLGLQSDGVHRVLADTPVGVLVFGWDSFVSYGYAAGTQLEEINVR
jgi:IgGFc binding protein